MLPNRHQKSTGLWIAQKLRSAATFALILSMFAPSLVPFAEAGAVARSVGSNIVATGGTITTVQESGRYYKVHTFTSSGTFQVTSGSGKVWYLVVAGGGGGAKDVGGGGGAGGYRTNSAYDFPVTAQSYTITVGAGGTAGPGAVDHSNGGDSTFSTITSIGGGKGGHALDNAGSAGGSGGGGATSNSGPGAAGGAGTAGQGNNGGQGSTAPQVNAAGGGGGAGAVGAVAGTNGIGGAGGAGLSSSITGTAVTRAGGGGGGSTAGSGEGGAGGAGGGGQGGGSNAPVAGTANTGGGGGGGKTPAAAGAAGGSGVVIIRYPVGKTVAKPASFPLPATGGTITRVGNRVVHTFTSSGTFQVTRGIGKVWYLVVAGGAGGRVNVGGGGGAGGYRENGAYNYQVSVGSYTVTVGAGGAANTNGSNSVFDTITATGGGTGGAALGGTGSAGGSGGGGASINSVPGPGAAGGAGTAGEGNAGGAGNGNTGGGNAGGGGGGAGAVGATPADNQTIGGAGGNGTSSSITGSAVTRAGGGGGGARTSDGTGGTGGTGGGGAGGGTQTAVAGTANTGGGGGGGSDNNGVGAAGGSGVVIIAYDIGQTIKAPPAQGLVGWWPFDSAFVTDKIYDRSGKGNHGYFVGGATSTANVRGKLGKAMSFDGTDDYASINDSSSLDLTTIGTLSSWVYVNTFGLDGPSNRRIISKQNDAGSDEMYGILTNSTNSRFELRLNSSGLNLYTTTTNIPTGKWHHVVGTWDGTTAKIYLNGVLDNSAAQSSPSATTKALNIGSWNGGANTGNFSGRIDDVRIYNRALTYAEVAQLYSSR